jgi:hypothetical protein
MKARTTGFEPSPKGGGVRSWAERWRRVDDRLNPIVVKELRQAVRHHGALGLIGVFLVAQLVMLAVAIGFSDGREVQMGREIFSLFSHALTGALVLGVPLYAGARLLGECVGEQFDEFRLPGLSFARIFWGKTLSALVLDALVLSVMGPFAYACTLMRGIDLPTIALVMLVNVIFSGAGIMSLLAVACLIRTVSEAIGWGIFALFGAGVTVAIVVIFNQMTTQQGALAAMFAAVCLMFSLGTLYAVAVTLLYLRAKQVCDGAVFGAYGPALSPRFTGRLSPPPIPAAGRTSTTDPAS